VDKKTVEDTIRKKTETFLGRKKDVGGWGLEKDVAFESGIG